MSVSIRVSVDNKRDTEDAIISQVLKIRVFDLTKHRVSSRSNDMGCRAERGLEDALSFYTLSICHDIAI